MGIYSVFDDLAFLEREFPEYIKNSSNPTRWFKCRVCGDQFAYRRLLEAHKKLSVCFKEVQK